MPVQSQLLAALAVSSPRVTRTRLQSSPACLLSPVSRSAWASHVRVTVTSTSSIASDLLGLAAVPSQAIMQSHDRLSDRVFSD